MQLLDDLHECHPDLHTLFRRLFASWSSSSLGALIGALIATFLGAGPALTLLSAAVGGFLTPIMLILWCCILGPRPLAAIGILLAVAGTAVGAGGAAAGGLGAGLTVLSAFGGFVLLPFVVLLVFVIVRAARKRWC